MAPQSLHAIIAGMRHGVAVSCQAQPGSPMDSPEILAAFAESAQRAGACAIRANHAPNIAAIRGAVALPLIGLNKRAIPGFDVYITPEWCDVELVAAAGADIVALDATYRPRPGADNLAELIARVHSSLGLLVMADVAMFDEGLAAEQAGADLIATTLSGYTASTAAAGAAGPDLELVRRLAGAVSTPVVCEGRVHYPHEVAAVLDCGAWCVVVGTAITEPMWIARQFVEAALPQPLP